MAAHGNLVSYGSAKVVVPSDSAGNSFAALLVTVTGDVAVKNVGGTAITLVGVPAYTLIPFAVTQVLATGTTATNIIGLA